MSFLSNLWNSITGAVSSVGNLAKSQVANVTDALNLTGPLNPSPYAPKTDPTKTGTLEFYQKQSDGTAVGAGAYNRETGQYTTNNQVISNGGTTYANQQVYNDAQAQTALLTNAAYGVRPSTYVSAGGASGSWSAPTDSQGRTSSKDVGNPYMDVSGHLITPKVAFSGVSGQGGAGFTNANSTPMTGQVGAPGLDYARGAGGFGQGTTSTLYNQSSSDEQKRQQEQSTQVLGSSHTASALSSMQGQAQTQPPAAPQVPDVIDAGFVQSTTQKMNETLNSSSLSASDKQQVYAQLQSNLLAAKAKLDQQVAVPPNPVVDTQEQSAFMDQSADPFGVKSAIDQFKAEQTNLGQLETSRVELMKNIHALNEAYNPIIKEIKDNPNLPKALAKRKIENLAVSQKETLQGFLDQLQIVGQQISDQNETVNRAFNIVSFSSNQQDKATDNMRQQLQLMLSSGAIAGFTDLELKTFAQASNMPYQALVKAKEAALTPKTDPVQKVDKNGDLVSIDQKTGKELWRIKGFSSADTGAAPKTPTEFQSKNNDIATLDQAIQSGYFKGSSGKNENYTDSNGYFTTEGWKSLLRDLPTWMTANDVVERYGDRLSPYGITKGTYGLTPAQKTKLGY